VAAGVGEGSSGSGGREAEDAAAERDRAVGKDRNREQGHVSGVPARGAGDGRGHGRWMSAGACGLQTFACLAALSIHHPH